MGQELFDATTAIDITKVKELLKDPKLNVNWQEPAFRRTALIRACFKGNIQIVQLLLNDPRTMVNLTQSQGATPFNIAVQYEHPDLVSLLLKDPRIDVNTPNEEGCSPFFFACQSGRIDLVEMLMADPRIDLNLAPWDGVTPLIVACKLQHVEVVEALVKDPRTNVNLADDRGHTALHVICNLGDEKLLDIILERDDLDINSRKPCVLAAQNGSVHFLKKIMATGKFLDFPSSERFIFGESAQLIQLYIRNPKETVIQLQREFGHKSTKISDTFTLILLVSDDYFAFSDLPQTPLQNSARRYLQIGKKLPLDVQYLLANITHGSTSISVSQTSLNHSLNYFFNQLV